MNQEFARAYDQAYHRMQEIGVFRTMELAEREDAEACVRYFYPGGPLCFLAEAGSDWSSCSLSELRHVTQVKPDMKHRPGYRVLLSAFDQYWEGHTSDGGRDGVARVLTYQSGRGRCGVDFGQLPDGRTLVLLTELPTNTGKSVTNAIEEILEIVLQRLQAPLEKVCIVEHYPQRGVTPPTFDEVHFPSGNLENPSWRRIPQQLVDELRACRERPR